MRFIFKNIFRSIKVHPHKNIIILFNIVMCTITVFVLLSNYYFLKDRFDEYYGSEDVASHYMIVMTDEDKQSQLSDLLNHSPAYYVSKQVDERIKSTPHLDLYYYMAIEMPLNYFNDRDEFEAYSYVNEDLLELMYETNEFIECSFIDVMFVSDNCDKVFNLKLSDGVFFEEDSDFNDYDSPVPVILGSDYSEFFNVGDIIELSGDEALVIGILRPNSYICGWGSIEYLDSKILTTCMFPRDMSIAPDDYNNMKYRIYNYVYCDDPTIDVQKEINKITAEYGYYTYELQPVDGIEITETRSISEKNVILIGFLGIISYLLCTSSLCVVLYNRTIQDREVFCIYMCNGISFWKIIISIAIEMMIYLFIAILPTFAISIIEFNEILIPFGQILLFSGLNIAASLLPIIMINKRNELDMFIRNKII